MVRNFRNKVFELSATSSSQFMLIHQIVFCFLLPIAYHKMNCHQFFKKKQKMHHRKNGSFSMLRTLPKTTLPNLRSEYLFNYVLSKDWIKNFAFTPLFSHYSLHSKFLIKTRLKTLFSLKATQGAMVTLSNANSKHCQRNTCFVVAQLPSSEQVLTHQCVASVTNKQTNFVGTEQTKLCWYRADKALSALYQQS